MKYKLSLNLNMSKTEDGSSIVLNSNDGQYYHFDESTTDFLVALIDGVDFEDFCKQISIKYSVDFSQVSRDYQSTIEELIQIKVLEVKK